MDTNEARRMALVLMADHGLTGEFHFEFTRSTRTHGITKFRTDRPNVIGLSRPLTEAGERETVHQTILHEIAHALVGPQHGHDRVWLAKARSIGYKGGRTVSGNPKQKAVVASGRRERKIEIVCTDHGVLATRANTPKAGWIDRKRCAICKSPVFMVQKA